MRVVDVIYVCSSKVLNTVVFKFSCGLDDGQMAGCRGSSSYPAWISHQVLLLSVLGPLLLQ